jgi:hypothetical protein
MLEFFFEFFQTKNFDLHAEAWNILARLMDHFLLNFTSSAHAPTLDRSPTHNRSGLLKSLYRP